MKKSPLLLLLCLLILPSIAQAHQIEIWNGGMVSGLMHPISGLDHFLAMLSVGILSTQMGRRAIWSVPAFFVGSMLIGGIMGMNQVSFFSVEFGITTSVLLLGLGITSEKKLPAIWMMLAVGFFALFHGYAHGTEMPHIANQALYVTGFIFSTIGIHIAGVLIGLFSNKVSYGPQFLRYVGAGIAGIGIHMILL